MVCEKELLDLIAKCGLKGFYLKINTIPNDMLILSSNSIFDLLEFAKLNNISTVLYSYGYYVVDDYLVDMDGIINKIDSFYHICSKDNYNELMCDGDTKDIIQLTSDVYYSKNNYMYLDNIRDSGLYYVVNDVNLRNFVDKMREDINSYFYSKVKSKLLEYNNILSNFDYNVPELLYLFVIYEGKPVGIVIYNNWLDCYVNDVDIESVLFSDFLDSYTQIGDILQKNIDDINYEKYCEEQKRIEDRKKLEELRNEFIDSLLEDEDFYKCTNGNLRRHYGKYIFDREHMQRYEVLFIKNYKCSGETYIDEAELNRLIDKAWKKYKNK